MTGASHLRRATDQFPVALEPSCPCPHAGASMSRRARRVPGSGIGSPGDRQGGGGGVAPGVGRAGGSARRSVETVRRLGGRCQVHVQLCTIADLDDWTSRVGPRPSAIGRRWTLARDCALPPVECLGDPACQRGPFGPRAPTECRQERARPPFDGRARPLLPLPTRARSQGRSPLPPPRARRGIRNLPDAGSPTGRRCGPGAGRGSRRDAPSRGRRGARGRRPCRQ